MKKSAILSTLLISIILFQFFISSVAAAEKEITFDFFYSGNCGECIKKFPVIQSLENDTIYTDYVTFNWKDRGKEEVTAEFDEKYRSFFLPTPGDPVSFAVIYNETNQTIISEDEDFTVEYLSSILDEYLVNVEITDTATPGFELIVLIGAISLSLIILRKRKKCE